MGELVDTKFRIFDCPICISEERAAYNRIRLDFIKLANEAAEQYETLYKQDGSIQKVVEKLGEQTHNCLVPALDYCIDTLVRYNVIDIDIQAFAEHYLGTSCLGCGADEKSCYSGCIQNKGAAGTTTSVFYGDTDNGGHILRVGGGQTGCVEGGYNQFSELRKYEQGIGID